MSFLTITPRDKKYLEYNVEGVPLRVVQGNGVDVKPNLSVTITDLFGGNKHFRYNSTKCMSFKIDILIKSSDKILVSKELDGYTTTDEQEYYDILELTNPSSNGWHAKIGKYVPMTEFLDYIMDKPVEVKVTGDDLIDVVDDYFLIIANPSRKQTYKKHTIWTLEFMQHIPLYYGSFQNTNSVVKKAIQKYEKTKEGNRKKQEKIKQEKIKTTAKYKLQHNCKYKQLVYSKKKKVVTCVKYMQQILNNKTGSKLVKDGWFGSETKKALVKFQTKYKKKYKLNPNGKVNKATFKALYSV